MKIFHILSVFVSQACEVCTLFQCKQKKSVFLDQARYLNYT